MMKKAYNIIRGDHDSIAWKSITCDNPGPPKADFITWLALWGKLKTRDILARWGVITDTKCVLCDLTDETAEHLFIPCPYSRSVWQSSLKWI